MKVIIIIAAHAASYGILFFNDVYPLSLIHYIHCVQWHVSAHSCNRKPVQIICMLINCLYAIVVIREFLYSPPLLI